MFYTKTSKESTLLLSPKTTLKKEMVISFLITLCILSSPEPLRDLIHKLIIFLSLQKCLVAELTAFLTEIMKTSPCDHLFLRMSTSEHPDQQ